MDFNTEQNGKATAHFDFGSSVHDLKTSAKRNIRNEVTNKDSFDPEQVIDAFERAKGIKKPQRNNLADYKFRNIILDPEQTRDQQMLNELLNNKKYMITLWKDTWTPQGNFRVFVIYGAKEADLPENQNNNDE